MEGKDYYFIRGSIGGLIMEFNELLESSKHLADVWFELGLFEMSDLEEDDFLAYQKFAEDNPSEDDYIIFLSRHTKEDYGATTKAARILDMEEVSWKL
jgi:hypothetical protein